VLPPALTGHAQPPAQRHIADQAADRLGQRADVAGWQEQTGFAVLRDEADSRARDVARDHRQACAHRFEQHHAERLGAVQRGQAERIGLRIETEQCRVVDCTGHPYA